MSRVRSPKYPNFAIDAAVENTNAIYDADRNYPITRLDVAKHMGYSSLSGAADKSISTLMQYGLLERVSKGEVKVSQLAIDILHPENDAQKKKALLKAAFLPPLFSAIRERFHDREPPSDQALRSWLLREQFNDRAINPIIKSYSGTCFYLQAQDVYDKDSFKESPNTYSRSEGEGVDNEAVPTKNSFSVGDYVNWESQGVLQLPSAKRVRHITDDGQWVFVEDSETGIPVNEVVLVSAVKNQSNTLELPPKLPIAPQLPEPTKMQADEAEWMRVALGPNTKVRLLVSGDIGAKEVGKLIKLLKAQRSILLDEDEEELI